MANPIIKQRRSYAANRPPLATEIVEGQIAINATMQGMWTRDTSGNIVQIGVKPSDLNAVAYSGDYNALSNKPNNSGALQYQGPWDASTNTPAIPAAATGNKTFYYVVATAGSTNIDGTTTWNVGDQLISDGTKWTRVPLSQPVDPTATVAFSLTDNFLKPVAFIFTRQCTFPLNFVGSQAQFTLATGTTATVTLSKVTAAGVTSTVGTISFASGAATFSSISTGTTVFSPGDQLIWTPTTTNMSGFAPNMKGQWLLGS